MNEIIDELKRLIPGKHKVSGRGFICFNCPSCGDKRGRFGILFTSSGGFRTRCQNGGCQWEEPTGWEPDNGFIGRPRRLFEIMGGDISDIPDHLLRPRPAARLVLSNHDLVQWWLADATVGPGYKENNYTVVLDFPSVSLPRDAQFLWETN